MNEPSELRWAASGHGVLREVTVPGARLRHRRGCSDTPTADGRRWCPDLRACRVRAAPAAVTAASRTTTMNGARRASAIAATSERGQPGVERRGSRPSVAVWTATSADSSATVTSAAVRATRGCGEPVLGHQVAGELEREARRRWRRAARPRWRPGSSRTRLRRRARRGPRRSRRRPRAAPGSRRARRGSSASATTTAPTATSCARREPGPVTRGQTRPRNAAAAAASSPYLRGSPSASPSERADERERVPEHEHADAGPPEPEPGGVRRSCWAVATAVDSSMVSCAASGRRQPRDVEQRRDLRAVEPVAHAEQPGGRDGGARRARRRRRRR